MRAGKRLLVVALAVFLVACGGEQLPWSDDFSDPASGWQAESDASAEVRCYEGVMSLLVKVPNRLAWASAGREFSDFRLAVEATQVAGPDDNEYGVLVRMRDADHFYRFSISGDGYYLVSKYDGGAWEVLNGDWTSSAAIHLGAVTNLLEIVCRGATMTFLVNGVTLTQVEDSSYSRGDVGLYAGSFFEPGVEIHFDNLTVTEP
ncbi:MAG: family 16 glycoside hydrolase [Anaerolineae bacterium]